MPTSSNRRRIEIPAALFVRLEERARRDGQTIAGLVATLLAGALDVSAQPSPGTASQESTSSDLRALLQQLLHNDTLQLRELQFLQQRLDLALSVLVEDQHSAELNPGEAPAPNRVARQRLLEALTETYIVTPPRSPSTLAQSGEPRPILSRTLWQRPPETPERETPDKPEE